MKKTEENFLVGEEVEWKWMGRSIKGTVKEIFFNSVTKVIKGKSIKRNGTIENPAYLVESSAGNLALKLNSELMTPKKAKSALSKPTLFK